MVKRYLQKFKVNDLKKWKAGIYCFYSTLRRFQKQTGINILDTLQYLSWQSWYSNSVNCICFDAVNQFHLNSVDKHLFGISVLYCLIHFFKAFKKANLSETDSISTASQYGNSYKHMVKFPIAVSCHFMPFLIIVSYTRVSDMSPFILLLVKH